MSTLQSVSVNGLNIAHSFQYNSYGELTQLTTPLGGQLNWAYRTNAYSTRSYREVQTLVRQQRGLARKRQRGGHRSRNKEVLDAEHIGRFHRGLVDQLRGASHGQLYAAAEGLYLDANVRRVALRRNIDNYAKPRSFWGITPVRASPALAVGSA
jgi:hypothetical protein